VLRIGVLGAARIAPARSVGGDPAANLTPPEDSVRTMRLIEAGGPPLRGTR